MNLKDEVARLNADTLRIAGITKEIQAMSAVISNRADRELNAAKVMIATQAEKLYRLSAQRDELLEALRGCEAALSDLLSVRPISGARVCGSTTLGNHAAAARAAIAKADRRE